MQQITHTTTLQLLNAIKIRHETAKHIHLCVHAVALHEDWPAVNWHSSLHWIGKTLQTAAIVLGGSLCHLMVKT